MSKAKPANKSLVPTLPEGYRDGSLPQLPPRTEFVMLESEDLPSHVNPASMRLVDVTGGGKAIAAEDQAVINALVQDTLVRDRRADNALADILAMLAGKELDADVLHRVRMRLRELTDEVHRITRVSMAYINQRERVRDRCNVDPVQICTMVYRKVADGSGVQNAFFEVAAEVGVAMETVRNAYYKHRKTVRNL